VRRAYGSPKPVQLTMVFEPGNAHARIGAREISDIDLPSTDLNAEAAVLGTLLYDNDALDLMGALQPADFAQPTHSRLFAMISTAAGDGHLAEPIMLHEALAGDPAYETLGGLRYLADLVDRAPRPRESAVLARALRSLAERRRGQSELQTEVESAEADDALAGALAEARGRGAARAAEILAGRDMLSADDFARLIGVTREAVRQKLRRHEIIGLQGAKRGVRYPAWQVSGDGALLPALPRLSAVLGESPWTLYRFLTQPNPAFKGKPPLDSLRTGRIEPVIAAAQSQARGDFG
jgi:hypothetical protein